MVLTVDADADDNFPRSPDNSLTACIIQKSYRHALKRRNTSTGQGISALCSDYFMECLNHSHTMKWGKHPYWFIYLGLLPHLLLCLNWIIDKAKESKENIKKRHITCNSPDEMDILRDSQTKWKYIFLT